MFQKIYCYLKSLPLEHNKKLLVIMLGLVMLFALVPRIAGMIVDPESFYHNDGMEYRDIAEQISKGNGFSVSYYRWYEAVPDVPEPLRTDFSRPPMLPLLGAALFLLPFDWEISAIVTVHLMSLICILLVFLLGREVFKSNTIGFLSAVIYAFYPYSIYHSLCWSSENLFLIFFCAAWIFLIQAVRNDFNLKQAALCGVFMALATMTRPQGALVFIILGAIAAVVFFKTLWKEREYAWRLFRGTAVFGISALVVFSPWMIRNWYHCGIPSPFSFYGAYSFAQASSDVSYVTYQYVDTPQYQEKTDAAWDKFHKEKTNALKEKKAFTLVEADPYWKQWAWEYIRENPGKMAFIVRNRVLHCFRAAPNAAAVSPKIVIILRIYFVIFLALILCGIWYARKNRAAISLLIPPLCALILAVPFLMILRYRYPFFAPFAAIFAAYGFYELCRRFFNRKSSKLNLELPQS
ncbi:MAG: hypothetical protein E7040_11940 [Lentisphaerae bacterium]|nr:hypothetical protein [Lentisphaerota bacterium]